MYLYAPYNSVAAEVTQNYILLSGFIWGILQISLPLWATKSALPKLAHKIRCDKRRLAWS